jgi:2,4-dienoyl-CoA reductase-like NADH-dependent reductase (Old Yellow Enzyme family)/thioredoxin reductase
MSVPAPPAAFRRLFSPVEIGSVVIPNRIVNTAHHTGLDEERDVRYIQERARGGTGFIGLSAGYGVYEYSVGPAAIDGGAGWDVKAPDPASDAGIAFYDDVLTPALERRAHVVHAEGARCFGQVGHSGAGEHRVLLTAAVGPSAVPDPHKGMMVHPLTNGEIEELIVSFAQGVRRVRDAGIDVAEIHGAHGYLISQFMSPYFNRREDRWGGSRENRLRFPMAILEAARELVGDQYPIGIRIGTDSDGAKRGLTTDELVEISKALAPYVAYISVSGGNYAGFGDGIELAYVGTWYVEPGIGAPVSAAVRAAVDVPVMLTGRIADGSVAESLLADGAADMIGMVRALIADPEWPKKMREGRGHEVRMCLGMSECHHIGKNRVPITCSMNASVGREAEMELRPAAVAKEVAVVGAGPAGLEAARVAALRGHHVYLCDAERAIGGTVRILAMDPNRRNLRDHAAFFETAFEKLDIELLLGNVVNAEELIEFGLDAVVLATGGKPLVPDVPGIDGANVVHALDVLKGTVTVGPRAVVVGGVDNDIAAPTVGEYLADQGRQVEVVSEQFDFAHGAEDATRVLLLHRLRTKGVAVSMLTKLAAVEGGDAVLRDSFTGVERRLADTTVVLACGSVPNDELALALEGKVPELHVVGDAVAPRRVMHATIEGARVGHTL